MTVQESINKSLNFFAVATFAIVGTGSLFQAIQESDFDDKVDDLIIVILVALALLWYLRSGSALKRSWIPALLIAGAVVAEIAALGIEGDDPAAYGPDIGYLVFFVLTLLVFLWQYFRNRRMIAG